jgi:hypothetical protein
VLHINKTPFKRGKRMVQVLHPCKSVTGVTPVSCNTGNRCKTPSIAFKKAKIYSKNHLSLNS